LVCIIKHRAAHAFFADDGADPRECNVEPHRFGELWREQAELDLARAAGLGRESQRQNGGLVWMGV